MPVWLLCAPPEVWELPDFPHPGLDYRLRISLLAATWSS